MIFENQVRHRKVILNVKIVVNTRGCIAPGFSNSSKRYDFNNKNSVNQVKKRACLESIIILINAAKQQQLKCESKIKSKLKEKVKNKENIMHTKTLKN